MPEAGAALAGLGVLVTRPAHQAAGLCQALEGHGASVYRFPVLEIAPPADRAPLQHVAARLADYDWAIFISANAVNRALDIILAERRWPESVRIAVIGRRSAQELKRYGLAADLCPEARFDSDALLALPALQRMAGQRCVIFRGNGGREMLAETLRARGAEVDYIEAYRRLRPASDSGPLLEAWRGGGIDVVVINSAESLRNLVAMIGSAGVALLRQSHLLVVSERMLPIVAELGCREPPILAANATDEAVVRALLAWRDALSG